jgi:hypothetical protein
MAKFIQRTYIDKKGKQQEKQCRGADDYNLCADQGFDQHQQ